MTLRASAFVLALATFSCAAEPRPLAPTTAIPPPPVPGAKGQPAPGDWARWTFEQKQSWMKEGVLPTMHGLFAGIDAARYGDMTCKTCHGVGAMEGSFKMPNDALPKLDPSPEAFKKLAQTNAAMFEFMENHVEPTMAGLLALQPHDMKTNTGFGCFHCHTKK